MNSSIDSPRSDLIAEVMLQVQKDAHLMKVEFQKMVRTSNKNQLRLFFMLQPILKMTFQNPINARRLTNKIKDRALA